MGDMYAEFGKYERSKECYEKNLTLYNVADVSEGDYALAMIGLGNVNRNFLKILELKADLLERQYGLAFRLVCVADSSGVAINTDGFDPAQLRQFKETGSRVRQR